MSDLVGTIDSDNEIDPVKSIPVSAAQRSIKPVQSNEPQLHIDLDDSVLQSTQSTQLTGTSALIHSERYTGRVVTTLQEKIQKTIEKSKKQKLQPIHNKLTSSNRSDSNNNDDNDMDNDAKFSDLSDNDDELDSDNSAVEDDDDESTNESPHIGNQSNGEDDSDIDTDDSMENDIDNADDIDSDSSIDNTVEPGTTKQSVSNTISSTSSSDDDTAEDNLRRKQRNKRQKLNNDSKTENNIIRSATTISKPINLHTFDELKLSTTLLRAINQLEWTQPSSVQSATIPVALQGKDLLVNAMTGSGKTAAFILPCLERLLHRPKNIRLSRILVLTPTRELAAQIVDITVLLCKYTDISTCLVVGGLSEKQQEIELRNGPDVIVATPGRLVDHIRNTKNIHLDDIEVLVIDEADRMLELEFSDEVREIVRACPRQRQTMLFSATLSHSVNDLVELSLNSPVRIVIDPYETIVDKLIQEFIRIKPTHNTQLEREAIILSICKRVYKSKTIIFCQQKVDCHRLALIFGFVGLRCAELHGNLTQAQRVESLNLFKSGHVDYLLCTDIAARGIDIKNVETVINMSLPAQLKSYVHRVGRTARAGESGRSCSLVSESERSMLKLIIKKASDVVVSRTVQRSTIDRYIDIITELEDSIHDVLQQEYEEKEQRLAEMEMNKAQNMILHKNQIHSKPAKTWIMNEKMKYDIKKQAPRLFNTTQSNTTTTTATNNALTQQDVWRAEKQAKYAKDKYAGLSRDKKRRLKLQDELNRESRKQAREQAKQDALQHGSEYKLNSKQLSQQKKPVLTELANHAAKYAKRQQSDKHTNINKSSIEHTPDTQHLSANYQKKQQLIKQRAILANRYADDMNADRIDSRFTSAQKHADAVDAMKDKQYKQRKTQAIAGHHTFKSKAKFKRR